MSPARRRTSTSRGSTTRTADGRPIVTSCGYGSGSPGGDDAPPASDEHDAEVDRRARRRVARGSDGCIRAAATMTRVLVSGMLAGDPGQGGATWAVLQWI